LFGETYGEQVASAIPPLALVTPLAFVGLLATMTLAGSEGDRGWILVAYVLGSVVNVVLVFSLAPGEGAKGAAVAAAAGIGVSAGCVCFRYLRLLARSLRGGLSDTHSPAPYEGSAL
jgi:O-antigen/teichoic acid export membrane protein